MATKKKRKRKKRKDYLMWLVPLIMMVFLALEAVGLFYMTKYYGKATAEEEDETTSVQIIYVSSGSVSTEDSETVEGESVPDSSKRDWDGEFGGVDMGNNVFTITWTSDFATTFEVQKYDSSSLTWETVNILDRNADEDGAESSGGAGSIAEDGTCTYTTSQLEPFQEHRYRVLAQDEDTWAVSPTLVCATEECAISSTVWPVKDLTAYTTSSGSTKAGTVETLKAYLVVDEADGRFGLKVGDETWYVDSNYCMINLPDYIGELCEYDITNSYSSMYMVHGYEIPNVTNTVIVGYEDVSLEGNEYLVPLLYPAAQKLIVAATSAKELGYHIKIYDSYRPNVATKFLYQTMSDLLSQEIADTGQTWRDAIIGNTSYTLNYFVAKGYSKHNLGVAMDLTLVDDSTGWELEMQTQLHDLSYHSEVSENTESATLLREIMVDAGFGTLSSEWWHFQDNDARADLDLPVLTEGVSPLSED